jgi:hypothetical protein
VSVPTGSEAANEAGEETEEEGVEEDPPVDIDGDIYRDASCLSSSPLTGIRTLLPLLRPESPCRRGPLDLAIETASN